MKQIVVNGTTVPIAEMDFKELQEQYDGKDEILGFYSQQHRNISICNNMDKQAKKDLIFHEAMHALMNIKYDNLTDRFQLDEEATVRLITSCREDIVDIQKQIDNAFKKNVTVQETTFAEISENIKKEALIEKWVNEKTKAPEKPKEEVKYYQQDHCQQFNEK